MDGIEITAGGLLLRPWQRDDADAVLRACQDPLIQRWTQVPVPYRPEHAAGFVGELSPRAWAEGTGAPLAVLDARSGELLGANGLVTLDRRLGVGEVGYWTAPWARGRGVAERATRAVAGFAFGALGLRRLGWRAELGNHTSRLVAERVGFTVEGVLRGGLPHRDRLVDGWIGALLPGEVAVRPRPWVAPGGPGARRASVFSRAQPHLPAGQVVLRPLAPADLTDIVTAANDPRSREHTRLPVPYRESDADFFLGYAERAWARGDGAVFAVSDPATDRYLGSMELRIDPVDPSRAEVGFLVAPWARGRGHATAALRAVAGWGLIELGVARVVWRAHVGNVASRRVAEKAGFRFEGVERSCLDQRGERRDTWLAALVVGDLAGTGAGDADERRPAAATGDGIRT